MICNLEGEKCSRTDVYVQIGKKEKVLTVMIRGKEKKVQICTTCKTLFLCSDSKKIFDYDFIIYKESEILSTTHHCRYHTSKEKLYLTYYRIGTSFFNLKYRYCKGCEEIYDFYFENGEFIQQKIEVLSDLLKKFLINAIHQFINEAPTVPLHNQASDHQSIGNHGITNHVPKGKESESEA